ncbi:MAG: FAD-dependent oxidoreductase [Nanoarchaeota archaeon]
MTRIVVVGCSYGGLKTLLTLRKLFPQAELVGVDPSPYHVNITGFPRYFAGEMDSKELLLPLHEFLAKHHIEFFQEEVTGLSPNSRHLYTANRRMDYDYLILAFGASHKQIPNPTTGLFSPYTLQEVKELRTYLEKNIYQGKPIHAVIVGAGLAGVEWGCGLAEYLNGRGTVTILEQNSVVLKGYSDKVRNYVLKKLRQKNIHIQTNTQVEKIEHSTITFDKGKMPYTAALLFVGVCNHTLVEKLGLESNENGILVHNTLQTLKYPNVFVVGDAVSLVNQAVQPIKRATSALLQGPIAARNILHHYEEEALEKYPVNEMPLGIYLGHHQGLVYYKEWMYTGWFAWWSKKFRETHYL